MFFVLTIRPQPKYIWFTFRKDKINQKILIFEKLESENLDISYSKVTGFIFFDQLMIN